MTLGKTKANELWLVGGPFVLTVEPIKHFFFSINLGFPSVIAKFCVKFVVIFFNKNKFSVLRPVYTYGRSMVELS